MELLGKHLGLYPTRGTLSIALDGQVDVQHTHRIEGRRVARRLILEEIREEDGLSLETGTGRVALPLNTDDFVKRMGRAGGQTATPRSPDWDMDILRDEAPVSLQSGQVPADVPRRSARRGTGNISQTVVRPTVTRKGTLRL